MVSKVAGNSRLVKYFIVDPAVCNPDNCSCHADVELFIQVYFKIAPGHVHSNVSVAEPEPEGNSSSS
jgi:hypothetical protein